MKKKIYFRGCSELGDGSCSCTFNSKGDLLDAVSGWCDNALSGYTTEEVTVQAVKMTEKEFNNLPEI